MRPAVGEKTNSRKGRALKIAITGGTGFVGRTLAARLAAGGHRVVLVARGRNCHDRSVCLLPGVTLVHASVTDERRLRDAFAGCHGVVHLAGITHEEEGQTFGSVHVRGTAHALAAAAAQAVPRFVMLSTSQASPGSDSPFHRSKGEAEALVRESLLSHTIVRADVVYGRGDRMLDHLDHALRTLPVFPLVGYRRPTVRPVAVRDVVRILEAAVTGDALAGATVAAVGPDELCVSDVVRTVGVAVRRRPWFIRMPAWVHRSRSTSLENVLNIPLSARNAGEKEALRSDGVSLGILPPDLVPAVRFTIEGIRARLPDRSPRGHGVRAA